MLIPWSTFWERNYFVEWSPVIEAVLTGNYLRGAISGLGVVNIGAALVELAEMQKDGLRVQMPKGRSSG